MGIEEKTGSLISKDLPKDGNRVWKIITPSVIEPVTVDELKDFAHIDGDDEDSSLEGFIKSARIATEEYLGRALIQQTIRMLMDYWPGKVIELPMPPLISVIKVATLGENDAEAIYDSDNYYVVTEAIPGKLILKKSVAEPVNTSRDYGGFLIEHKAGYGIVAANVPSPIREGIKLWAAVAQSTRVIDPKKPPPEARSKLDLFRTIKVMVR